MARVDRSDWAVAIAATAPSLIVRLGATYLRFLSRRRHGTRTFRRALQEGGVPRAEAETLARSYEEATSFRRILRGARKASHPDVGT